MIPCRLVDAYGQQVKVDDGGAVLVSKDYDLTKYQNMDVINTAYSFFPPFGDQRFVMTGFVMYADQQVATVTNATVIIYESSSPTSTTTDRVLFQTELGQNQSLPVTGINILSNKGVYINAKTDDDDVHLTIFGHYVQTNGKIPAFIV